MSGQCGFISKGINFVSFGYVGCDGSSPKEISQDYIEPTNDLIHDKLNGFEDLAKKIWKRSDGVRSEMSTKLGKRSALCLKLLKAAENIRHGDALNETTRDKCNFLNSEMRYRVNQKGKLDLQGCGESGMEICTAQNSTLKCHESLLTNKAFEVAPQVINYCKASKFDYKSFLKSDEGTKIEIH